MARRKDHTRKELTEMIINTAWDIVGDSGFSGLTARKIAHDIGYAPGTIYNIFASMEDLYLAVNARTLDRLYDILTDPKCNNPDHAPIDNMKNMARSYHQFSKSHRPYWLMLFTYTLPEKTTVPIWYLDKVRRLFIPLEQILQPICPEKNIKKAARILWASVHGLFFLEGTGKIPLITDQDIAIEMADYLLETFTTGIKKTDL